MKGLSIWVRSSLQRQSTLMIVTVMMVLLGLFLIYDTGVRRQETENHLLSKGRAIALGGALSVQHILEDAIQTGRLTEAQVFDTNYQPIPGTDPQKYHTAYDAFSDQTFLSIEDGFLADSDVIYAVAEDINGYIPTHNTVYTQPLTGDRDTDLINNRTKRIFDDITGLTAAKNTEPFLRQDYARDTGVPFWDISVPIYVNGKHWGAFRVGFTFDRVNSYLSGVASQTALAALFMLVAIIICSLWVTRPLKLLTDMSRLANRVAVGDTSKRIEIKRIDEIGTVANAFNRIIDYYQSNAQTAEKIAQGNLNVQIDLKSEADFLGRAFIKMAEHLRLQNSALEKERALLQTLMDNSNDYIYFKDLESRFIRASKSQVRRFGTEDAQTIIGKTDFDLFSEEHARPAYEDEQNIIHSGKSVIDKEEEEVWPDGSRGWVSSTKMPFRDENGQTIGTFGISRDISERKQMEFFLQHRLRELETVNEFLISIRRMENTGDILQNLLEIAINTADTKDGAIYLLDDKNNGRFTCSTAAGWFSNIQQTPVHIEDSLVEDITNHRVPFISQQTSSSCFIPDVLPAEIPPHWNGGFFPIICRAQTIGVLIIATPSSQNIGDDRFNLITILTQVAGNAVVSTRLNEQLSLTNENLQVEINQRITIQGLLEREKDILNTTLLSINEGVIATDSDGLIVFFNHSAEEITGYNIEEIIDQPIWKALGILNPGSGEIVDDIFDELYKINKIQQEKKEYHTSTIIDKNGHKKVIRASISDFNNIDQELSGHVVVFQDVTQAQKAEAQSALSQKMESIGQLASGIAHEINTPNQYIGDNLRYLDRAFQKIIESINVYRGFIEKKSDRFPAEDLEQINQQVDEKKIQRYLSEVPNAISDSLSGVDRVRKIVLAMREFSHPSQKEMRQADINHAIETTATISHNEWKYVADLETDLDPKLPQVTCQIDEINQVILNMIVNSAQAIQEIVSEDPESKGKISINTRVKDRFVVITIRDTGNGIPDVIKDRVFDPFFTTKGVGKGTGQGLYLAHNIIVNKHHGHISLESEQGKGTTFFIEIPIDQKGIE